ncbi:hypothetical protein SLS60_000726 [Paraconiothyrium brasiliense]|uniref:Uncharacterized protein n=1 Tax=Paraconiothyrium brasiliense TaxID=300254 RepID=A0ABR3S733_9PLEO
MSSALPSLGADGEGDTTLFIATAASYDSDGPTLPIIGGTGEHAEWVAPNPEDRPIEEGANSRLSKRRRTKGGIAPKLPGPENKAQKTKVEAERLYKPWTLLPVEVLQQIEGKLNGKWEEKVEAVVWTKNQNVKSGINCLKGLLGFEGNPEAGEKYGSVLNRKGDDGLVAISAYGEGTTKLVGIVEVTKRVVGGDKQDVQGRSGEAWFTYTALSSTSGKDVKNKVPVLTIWFSRKCIPELKSAFGEQTLQINRTTATD